MPALLPTRKPKNHQWDTPRIIAHTPGSSLLAPMHPDSISGRQINVFGCNLWTVSLNTSLGTKPGKAWPTTTRIDSKQSTGTAVGWRVN